MTLHAIKSPDEELEEQIQEAYLRLINTPLDQSREVYNEFVSLCMQRSERQIERMEQERMQRIRDGK